MTRVDPLTFPLAGLLAQPPGTQVAYPVDGVTILLDDDLRLTAPIEGMVSMSRTNRGILVGAPLRTAIAGSCSRCLAEIEIPLELRIVEEVLPAIDIATGMPLDRSAEPDVARLNDHHELELEPLVREAVSLAEPIAPLCSEDCLGLCIDCGARLGRGHPDHDGGEVDPRLAALRAFRVDGAAENG
ncbi:MAG TPA: DUF177 domain-containing protein [Candidatus Sulfomarinibacteraceae bacterium]|nr:DUF177 domain-containing protein [Candidatus Sulfomarinibacteraceae bacterium]